MSYLEVSSGQATVVGIVGGGERELPYFKMRELLPHTDQPISKERSKERSLNLRDLSRISFGLEKLHPFVSIPGKEYEEPYCEVELEATDGKKESFPCLHRSLIFSVQYADGIGKEKLNGDLLNGMTFRAGE